MHKIYQYLVVELGSQNSSILPFFCSSVLLFFRSSFFNLPFFCSSVLLFFHSSVLLSSIFHSSAPLFFRFSVLPFQRFSVAFGFYFSNLPFFSQIRFSVHTENLKYIFELIFEVLADRQHIKQYSSRFRTDLY